LVSLNDGKGGGDYHNPFSTRKEMNQQTPTGTREGIGNFGIRNKGKKKKRKTYPLPELQGGGKEKGWVP